MATPGKPTVNKKKFKDIEKNEENVGSKKGICSFYYCTSVEYGHYCFSVLNFLVYHKKAQHRVTHTISHSKITSILILQKTFKVLIFCVNMVFFHVNAMAYLFPQKLELKKI